MASVTSEEPAGAGQQRVDNRGRALGHRCGDVYMELRSCDDVNEQHSDVGR